jgi:hypothetical protein
VSIWLTAEQITDLVLVRADLFAPSALEDLVALADAAGTRTWLIHNSATSQRATTRTLAARIEDRVQVPSTAQTNTPTGARTFAAAEPWATPSRWISRAAATRQFEPREFDELDACIYAAYTTTSAWLSAQKRVNPTRLECFLDTVSSDAHGQRRHARLTGALVALLLHGLLAEVRERPRRAVLVRAPAAAVREIRRFSEPVQAALYTLALFTDLDQTTLSGLTLDQIIDAPKGVLLGGYLFTGATAAPFRAIQAERAHHAAAPTARIFSRPQLARCSQPVGRGPARETSRLTVRLAALEGPLDLISPQPQLDASCRAPSLTLMAQAALILRLLRMKRSHRLLLSQLTRPQQRAAHELAAVHAVRVSDGSMWASEHLRFSHFLAETPRYLLDTANTI